MVTFQEVVRYVFAEPFRPFRIRMARGQVFEIREPEMVHVGLTTMNISTFLSDDEQEVSERHHEISLLSIESIELLEVESTA